MSHVIEAAWERRRTKILQGNSNATDESNADIAELSQAIATTLPGVIAKLREAMYANTSVSAIEVAAAADGPLASFDRIYCDVLKGDDFPTECIWTAIISLEAMIEASAIGGAE